MNPEEKDQKNREVRARESSTAGTDSSARETFGIR
jgi:hypothetical protein